MTRRPARKVAGIARKEPQEGNQPLLRYLPRLVASRYFSGQRGGLRVCTGRGSCVWPGLRNQLETRLNLPERNRKKGTSPSCGTCHT